MIIAMFITFLLFGSGFIFGRIYEKTSWTRQIEQRKQDRIRSRVENERL